MEYIKPTTSIPEQVKLLKSRNLIIEDEEFAKDFLSNVNYYRFSQYLYPFRLSKDPNQNFTLGTRFEDVLKIYSFDRKLRLLIFDCIERIEISLRTILINKLSEKYDKYWYMDEHLFQKKVVFDGNKAKFSKMLANCKEDIFLHFKSTCAKDKYPPAWIGLELFTFGQLSKVYENLKHRQDRKIVATHYDLSEYIFSSWIHSLSYIRNLCAHHSRLWDRSLSVPPKTAIKKLHWLRYKENLLSNLTYFFLCIIKYIIDRIHPANSLANKLYYLINSYPSIDISRMNFPQQWQDEQIWQLN